MYKYVTMNLTIMHNYRTPIKNKEERKKIKKILMGRRYYQEDYHSVRSVGEASKEQVPRVQRGRRYEVSIGESRTLTGRMARELRMRAVQRDMGALVSVDASLGTVRG